MTDKVLCVLYFFYAKSLFFVFNQTNYDCRIIIKKEGLILIDLKGFCW